VATRAIVRPTSDTRWLPPEVERAIATVEDDEALGRAVRDATVVFHLAAVTSTAHSGEYARTNADGTRRVLDSVRRCAPGARVVLCSSLAAVGPARSERPLIESVVPRPVSAYGRSKLAAEQVAEAFAADHRLEIVIVRPGAVYGPRDRDILAAFRLARRGLAVRVSSSEQRLAMVHVRDLVHALVLASRRAPFGVGEVRRYHVSDGTTPTWSAVNAAIAAAVGRRARALGVPRGAALAVAALDTLVAQFTHSKPLLTRDRIAELSAADWSCDIERAREELGFAPRVELEAGMRQTAEWYRTQGWL
jgi:nucleoside-diphosphate-sugar epimerase